MKIVIVGIGKIGYILTEQLCHEGHDVVIIDKDAELLINVQNKLDVAVIHGNGASVEIQQEANVSESDLLIAVTSSDEVNLLCSIVAHKLGCKSIITRVRNPEYDRQMKLLDSDLGITFSFNPEKASANEIFHLLQFPSFIKKDSFSGGRADMVELRLPSSCQFVGKKLSELDIFAKCNAIVCAAERQAKVEIPDGNFELATDDKLTIASPPKELPKITRAFNIPTLKIKRVMLVGGSKIAAYLAKMLVESGVKVTIIELDKERCMQIAEDIPDATVICGNGTDQNLLIDEGVEQVDAVVTLTGVDEENFLISMFANHIGVPKTITKNNRVEYSDIFLGTGIDTIVSPKYLAASQIVRYVRAASASGEGSIETLYRILDDKAEALGFTVPENNKFINTPIEQVKFKKNILVAMIIRGQSLIIPRGSDCLMPGDSIIVVTKSKYSISKFADIFTSEG